MKEQAICATAIGGIKASGSTTPLTGQTKRLEQVSKAIEQLIVKKSELATFMNKVNGMNEESAKAHSLSAQGLELMDAIRKLSDEIEDVVSDEFWPLPKYREMLFLA